MTLGQVKQKTVSLLRKAVFIHTIQAGRHHLSKRFSLEYVDFLCHSLKRQRPSYQRKWLNEKTLKIILIVQVLHVLHVGRLFLSSSLDQQNESITYSSSHENRVFGLTSCQTYVINYLLRTKY